MKKVSFKKKIYLFSVLLFVSNMQEYNIDNFRVSNSYLERSTQLSSMMMLTSKVFFTMETPIASQEIKNTIIIVGSLFGIVLFLILVIGILLTLGCIIKSKSRFRTIISNGKGNTWCIYMFFSTHYNVFNFHALLMFIII